jgi:hypothetical protein
VRRQQQGRTPAPGRAGAGPLLAGTCLLAALAGCGATTTVTLTPAPLWPVCDASARALVLWQPQWRLDQKDVPAREAAAAEGLAQFVDSAGCFASATLQRLPDSTPGRVPPLLAEAGAGPDTVVVITVRELGPTLSLGGPAALLEGATEVRLDVAAATRAQPVPRAFTVHWRNGGPGVLKGVATLAQDMQAALSAGLRPQAR